jgi:two-component system cell cycle response regulator
MPSEAADAESALRLADQRMYDDKGGGRHSAQRQSRDVLVQALREHTASLGDHTQGLRELAEAVARRLGLDDTEVQLVGDAVALHDIGKMAIPRSIIEKPGPLDDEEWGFMRNQTIIGARILSAAPALHGVASAVRSAHERWDATGYPDGLPGPRIPLAARVVAVCDAFDAMISDRAYSPARAPSDAVRESRRCAGSQFDPAVVDAFEAVFANRLALPGSAAVRARVGTLAVARRGRSW